MNSPADPRPAPPSGPDTAPRPVAEGLGLLTPLLSIVALLALVVMGLAAGAHWLLFSEPGAQWLLSRAGGVQVEGFRGALFGPRWQADRIVLLHPDGQPQLELQALDLHGMRWTLRPHPQAWLALQADSLDIGSVHYRSDPAAPPLTLPASLHLPVEVRLAQARIGTLRFNDLAPATELSADGLVFDPRPDATHRIGDLALAWDGLLLQASAQVAHSGELPLQLQAVLRPAQGGDTPDWSASLQASGPLGQPQLQARLRGLPLRGRSAPELDLQASLRPFDPWPLAALSLHTQALDLSALHLEAPQTLLSGTVTLQSRAADAPLSAQIALDNARPGRWNEARLPLRRLRAELQGQLDQPGQLLLPRFEMELADATGAAGRWSGSAQWLDHTLTLKSQLQDLAPHRLDSRAAEMRLTGPVALQLQGLPSPDPSAAAPAGGLRGAWQLQLEGLLDTSPVPVQLALEGQADRGRLVLDKAQARAGAASADFSFSLQRNARRVWQLSSSGRLSNFDPLPWWPGDADSAWRQGPHRLSANWQVEAALPDGAQKMAPLALAQRMAGNGRIQVLDSMLAGVPLSADFSLRYVQAAAPTPATLIGELVLGGNRLRVEGRGDPAGEGLADRLDLQLVADQLAALAPLVRLLPEAAQWAPRQGAATATLSAAGRWPVLQTEGRAVVSLLEAGPAALQSGRFSWRMDTGGQQPLDLQLALAGLRWGEQQADHLRGRVQGTLAAHRISLSGAVPNPLPQQVVRVLGLQNQSGTLAQLEAQGAWQAAPAGGGSWRADIERIDIGSWDGSPEPTASASRWIGASDLRMVLRFSDEGSLQTLQADAGRLQVSDTVALRWDDVRLDLSGPQAQLALQADIEPFALAPLLDRLQPGAGWQGDLRLSAHVDIRATDTLRADVVFERKDGDLHMAGDEGMQLMGLTEARLALSARDGVWLFTPVFKGRSLGEISGTVRIASTPERRWPAAEDALQGQIQARVADIGVWGGWVPAGWRLAGSVNASAELAGSVGDPRYIGQLLGTGLSVRNLLEGVNVRDGQVAVRLEGDTARIEGFTLRGGEGLLTISGDAVLGTAPRARLHFKAERFRVLARVDRSIIASGEAEMNLTPEQGRLQGRLSVDEGFFDLSSSDAPTLDGDVSLRGAGLFTPLDPAAQAPRARRNFVLNLDLDLGDDLRIRGRGLDATLRGKLRLSSPGGQLAIDGTLNADGGTYAAYGQRLVIERANIIFTGAPDNPRLDVLALRPNLDVRVGVYATGNTRNPRVRLFSEPELGDSEKLSWLVLGRAPDGLGRSDTALLQRAAVALLAGESEGPTDSLLRNLGIDELSLRQGDSGDMRETVVTLGKQLSRRWYVGYERSVNATAGTWQLIYRIAQRFTVRAQSGVDSSLDVIWVWRTQETPADAAMRKSTLVPP